jgi:hypothetical protein
MKTLVRQHYYKLTGGRQGVLLEYERLGASSCATQPLWQRVR